MGTATCLPSMRHGQVASVPRITRTSELHGRPLALMLHGHTFLGSGEETGAWCATRFDERGSRARASERTKSEYALYDPGTRCPHVPGGRLAPMRVFLRTTALRPPPEADPGARTHSSANCLVTVTNCDRRRGLVRGSPRNASKTTARGERARLSPAKGGRNDTVASPS